MRKQKKSRVVSVGVQTFQGAIDLYYLTIPFDKKHRIIPSSVECAYNSRYFTLEQAGAMVRSL